MTDVETYLSDVAAATLVQVQQGLGGGDLDASSIEVLLGAGSGTHVLRVPWADAGRSDSHIVVKIFTQETYDFQSLSDDPPAFDYWQREWSFYRAAWPYELPDRLRPPRCLGSGELFDRQERPVAWVALEDLGPRQRWSTATFAQVARHAGVLNGWSATVTDPPRDRWLARDWLGDATETAGDGVRTVADSLDHPVLGRIMDPAFAVDMLALWEARPAAYRALRVLPQVLCHNDLFTRNVLRVDETGSKALDWAGCGWGAVGQELSALIGASAFFLDSDPAVWDQLERDCLRAYVEGLREAAWIGPAADAERGYLISFGLRWGLLGMPALATMTLVPELCDEVATVLGCSYEDFVTNSHDFLGFVHPRLRRARAALGV